MGLAATLPELNSEWTLILYTFFETSFIVMILNVLVTCSLYLQLDHVTCKQIVIVDVITPVQIKTSKSRIGK